jgi:2-hydroxychromene-2-carboxylate isomerase
VIGRFYYDLNSPYAYLAAHRIEELLPGVEWVPVAFGPMLAALQRTPWSLTPGEREEGMRECERRAAERGLPPIRWPEGWPDRTYSVDAARAAVVGRRDGRVREVTLALYSHVFEEGARLNDPALLEAVGAETGIPDLANAVKAPDVKAELRAGTEAALARGVTGIPTIETPDGRLFWGDDRLEEAAAA